MESPRVARAVLSVSDKTGLVEFAKGLVELGVDLYSTGGTRRALEAAGLRVIDVAEYTGFPEMMDGRVKTLHPKIFGGILCRRDQPEDMASVLNHGMKTFELVVVNLYPFRETVAKPGVSREDAIENIDIGGPSLVRATAKNHAFVAIATSAKQYPAILEELRRDGTTSLTLRKKLAAEAFAHTADYDRAIADYFAPDRTEGEKALPERVSLTFEKVTELRYGENPHQCAALYREQNPASPSLTLAKQLNGKELSYNNLLDLDSAISIVRGFALPAATVIKHNNPCGAAMAGSLALACSNALAGDPQSAFGGIIAFNRAVDVPTAEALSQPGLFIEAVAAPDFDPAALEILTTRPKWKANVRLLATGPMPPAPARVSYRQIEGGMLVQDNDTQPIHEAEWTIPTKAKPTEETLIDLRFAWEMVRHVKSNAIVVAKNGMLLGAGAGQMSRVDSVEISLAKAGERSIGAVMASDAFFPFPDSIHRAHKSGIIAVIQPGGSVKDAESIAACDEYGIAMIFTGRRHFKH